MNNLNKEIEASPKLKGNKNKTGQTGYGANNMTNNNTMVTLDGSTL
jgi:hypothetical protein